MKQSFLMLVFALCHYYTYAQHGTMDSSKPASQYIAANNEPANIPAADVLWRKADKLYDQKKYKAALDTIDKAIALAPGYADIVAFRYYALVKLRRFEEALATLERAYELDPSMEQYLQNKGNVLHELKQHDSALVYYQRALDYNPHDERYYYNYVYLLAELRRFKKLKKIGRQRL
jgi:tetratricopeptide (TPR) repeat protein